MTRSLVRDFIRTLNGLDHSKDRYTKFRDFLTLAYCALAKPLAVSAERAEGLEAEYMAVVDRYANQDDVGEMPKLLGMTALALQERIDFLGTVATELEILNKDAGQFFTPYEVSRMMAEVSLGGVEAIIEAKGFVTVQEPASGAGGMLLAVADALESRGFQLGRCLWFEATDIAEMPFHMTYIQTSLRGLAGRVYRGNSLSLETWTDAFTRAAPAFLGIHGNPFRDAASVPAAPDRDEPVMRIGEQLTLF